MRRVGLAVLTVTSVLAGCSSFRDIFTSHAETAARVRSHELKAARVAEIITRVGGAQANPQAAEVVAGVWVDLSLFGDRVARAQLQPDSALFERLLWPQLAQAKSSAWHDTIVAHRPPFTEAVVDSAYNADGVRLFQHILIKPAGLTAADTTRAQAQADRLLPQARTGSFARLALQHSEDGSKADSGYLPLWPRGATVVEFDSVAWRLGPGEVSHVVKSQFGFHIIRRPPIAEVRGRFADPLKQDFLRVQDSIYFARLTETNQLDVKSGAPAAMRSAMSDLAAARKSGKTLATYRDGSFTVADFVRWIGALAPPQIQQIRAANDTMLNMFATNLAQNSLLLREADSAGIKVEPVMRQGLELQMRAMIGDLKRAMGLDSAEFSDSSKTPVAQRVKLATERVDKYFDAVTKGEVQFRQVPPTLSAELRAEGDFKIYQAGIARSQELILAKRREDSTAAVNAPPPGASGPLQPAPGGPPTPGKQP